MAHHGEALRRLTKDDELLNHLMEDYAQADLSSSDRAMLDYAVKLTRSPAGASLDDIEALRDAGFDDRAILDIAQIVAYFAFVNRLACGLGVTLEKSWERA
jgi:uncharacterized peroxidase-related enzyme